MTGTTIAAPAELLSALHEVLVALRRDMEKQRQVDKSILETLRDINHELKFLRETREREARADRLLIAIDERQKRDDRIIELLNRAERQVSEITAARDAQEKDK
jgi:hypothetical protein